MKIIEIYLGLALITAILFGTIFLIAFIAEKLKKRSNLINISIYLREEDINETSPIFNFQIPKESYTENNVEFIKYSEKEYEILKTLKKYIIEIEGKRLHSRILVQK